MIHWLLGLWHTMYAPEHGPFYNGQVYGNVFVVAVLAPLGWLWSKTRFFPLNQTHDLLAGLHAKFAEHRRSVDDLHAKVDGLHDRHQAHTDHLERIGRSLADLHSKLDAPKPAPRRRKADP